jgi:hypothetical protein
MTIPFEQSRALGRLAGIRHGFFGRRGGGSTGDFASLNASDTVGDRPACVERNREQMLLTLGLGLTGYLLPWDQKGYGATKVATALMGLVPGVGPSLQKLVVGGTEYGNHTLTRFFALHAGLLPALMVGAVAAHVALFRRHGITAKQPLRRPEGRFWPDQVLMDGVACLAVMAAVLYLTLRHHGAELHAPADATQPFNAARPEWYFLFLFEFLKLEVLTSWFGHHGELVGAIIVPGAADVVWEPVGLYEAFREALQTAMPALLTNGGEKQKAESREQKFEGAIKIIEGMTAETWQRDRKVLLRLLTPVK